MGTVIKFEQPDPSISFSEQLRNQVTEAVTQLYPYEFLEKVESTTEVFNNRYLLKNPEGPQLNFWLDTISRKVYLESYANGKYTTILTY